MVDDYHILGVVGVVEIVVVAVLDDLDLVHLVEMMVAYFVDLVDASFVVLDHALVAAVEDVNDELVVTYSNWMSLMGHLKIVY